MTEKLKAENLDTIQRNFSFVKDKNTPLFPTEPIREYTFSDDDLKLLLGTDDVQTLDEYRDNPVKTRELIENLVDDKEDKEKVEYYLQNPTKAFSDLIERDLSGEFKDRVERGEIIRGQIITANEPTYDDLLARREAIEKTYPNITEKDSYYNQAIPRSIKRERMLINRYLELLYDSANELVEANAPGANSDKYMIADDGEIVLKDAPAVASNVKQEIDRYNQLNQGKVEDVEWEPKNAYAVAASILSEISNVQNVEQYEKLEKKIDSMLKPRTCELTLRGLEFVREKIEEPLHQKEQEVRLRSANGVVSSLESKYSGREAELKTGDFASLRNEENQLKQAVETMRQVISFGQDRLARLNEQLDKVPSYKKLNKGTRLLKKEISDQEEAIASYTTRLRADEKELSLVSDRLRYQKANAVIKRIKKQQKQATT